MSTTDSIREACETLNASDPLGSVEAGQVYLDHADGRRKIVEYLAPGPPWGDDVYAVIRAEDGHPHRTGVVSFSRLRGKGYTLVASVLSLLALSAPALATDPGAPAINARPSIAAIAPGGNISSVVDATARYGWPHSPSINERQDVTQIVLLSKVRRSGRAFCRFNFTLGRVACTTTVGRASKSWAVRVFEDGSYTITRKAVR